MLLRQYLRYFAFLFIVLTSARPAAAQIHVAPGGTGNGTSISPFGHIQDALNAAQPGDTVLVGPGTYWESIASVRSGFASLPITVSASSGAGSVLVTSAGRVATINHAYVVIDGLTFDGQYGADDAVRIAGAATGFTLRNAEVRRSGNDAIDMGPVQDVLIENSLIHHALNPLNGRTDAHGIVGGAVRHLRIRNTEIHTFSGDGIQVDAGRSAPGWDDVLVEGCKIWLAPLPAPENGFAAGTVTGENAVDTKAGASYPRARMTIRNTQAWGFKSGLLTNMAAFNLKENVDATIDGATVHDSEIGFRLRGPGTTGNGAWIRVQNSVVHDVSYGFRYEDNIENLRIWNDTVGKNVAQPFHAASSSASGLDVENLLLLGSALPLEASSSSNLAVPASSFANPTADLYKLAAGSSAIDSGLSLAQVTQDITGTARPQGGGYDVGAYERPTDVAPLPPPPPSEALTLTARGYKVKGLERVDLTWSGATSAAVDVYRNGELILTTPDDGSHTDPLNRRGGGTYAYTVCETGTATCSNVATVVF